MISCHKQVKGTSIKDATSDFRLSLEKLEKVLKKETSKVFSCYSPDICFDIAQKIIEDCST